MFFSFCLIFVLNFLTIYISEKAFWSKREWYFFSGLKQNRSTKKGFWKEVDFNEPIFTSNGDEVGMKNYLVFYGDEVGSKLVQTNWIMEEYHLPNNGLTNKSTSQLGQVRINM